MADPDLSARPVDRLVGGYLLLAGLLLLLPRHPDGWAMLLLAHLVAGGFLLAGGLERLRHPAATETPPAHPEAPLRSEWSRRAIRGLVDWYPLLLMPFLYWELPLIIQSIWGGRFFDPVVLGWEEALFSGQPSTTLARRWPWPPLSETLHAAYLAYYPLVYFFPLALYRRGRGGAFQSTLFALMLGFVVNYVIFAAFPVQGPRYLFPAPGGALADGPVYRLTHVVLENGSSRGAAFPSAHAAIAAVQTVNAVRWLPTSVPLVAAITAGLSVGAVYGGFHYGVDILAGLVLGFLLAVVAPRVRTALR